MDQREQDSDARDNAELPDDLLTNCHLQQCATGFTVELGSSNGRDPPLGRCADPDSEEYRNGYAGQGRSVEVSQEFPQDYYCRRRRGVATASHSRCCRVL